MCVITRLKSLMSVDFWKCKTKYSSCLWGWNLKLIIITIFFAKLFFPNIVAKLLQSKRNRITSCWEAHVAWIFFGVRGSCFYSNFIWKRTCPGVIYCGVQEERSVNIRSRIPYELILKICVKIILPRPTWCVEIAPSKNTSLSTEKPRESRFSSSITSFLNSSFLMSKFNLI